MKIMLIQSWSKHFLLPIEWKCPIIVCNVYFMRLFSPKILEGTVYMSFCEICNIDIMEMGLQTSIYCILFLS